MSTDALWTALIISLAVGAILVFGGWLAIQIKLRRESNKGPRETLFGPRQIREWERIFSWRPVRTIDKGWVWLRYYWRRQIYTPASVDGDFEETYYYQNVIQIAWYTY